MRRLEVLQEVVFVPLCVLPRATYPINGRLSLVFASFLSHLPSHLFTHLLTHLLSYLSYPSHVSPARLFFLVPTPDIYIRVC
jgi:hypothetical protein